MDHGTCNFNICYCDANSTLKFFPGASPLLLVSFQNEKSPYKNDSGDMIKSLSRINCVTRYIDRNITVDKLFLNETCKHKEYKISISRTHDFLDAYSGLPLKLNRTYVGNYSNSYRSYALISTNVRLNGTVNNIKNSLEQQNYVPYYLDISGELAVILVVSIAAIKVNRKH